MMHGKGLFQLDCEFLDGKRLCLICLCAPSVIPRYNIQEVFAEWMNEWMDERLQPSGTSSLVKVTITVTHVQFCLFVG